MQLCLHDLQVGQVILTLPYSMAQTGMVLGILLQLGYAAMASFTAYLMNTLYLEHANRLERAKALSQGPLIHSQGYAASAEQLIDMSHKDCMPVLCCAVLCCAVLCCAVLCWLSVSCFSQQAASSSACQQTQQSKAVLPEVHKKRICSHICQLRWLQGACCTVSRSHWVLDWALGKVDCPAFQRSLPHWLGSGPDHSLC